MQGGTQRDLERQAPGRGAPAQRHGAPSRPWRKPRLDAARPRPRPRGAWAPDPDRGAWARGSRLRQKRNEAFEQVDPAHGDRVRCVSISGRRSVPKGAAGASLCFLHVTSPAQCGLSPPLPTADASASFSLAAPAPPQASGSVRFSRLSLSYMAGWINFRLMTFFYIKEVCSPCR